MDVQQGRIHGYSISFDYSCPVCGVEYEIGIPLEHREVLGCPNDCGAEFTLLVRDGDYPQLVSVQRPQSTKSVLRGKEVVELFRAGQDDLLRGGRAMKREESFRRVKKG